MNGISESSVSSNVQWSFGYIDEYSCMQA